MGQAAVAAKKSLPLAVDRNRAKRLARELFRTDPAAFAAGWEIVLVVRPGMLRRRLADLRKVFGDARHPVTAVDGVSLSLAPGEVLAVLGHNGAGKSTLMQMIAGALPFDGGELLLSGQPVKFSSPADSRAAGIETIHQKLALADNLDSVANLFLGRELRTRFGLLDDAAMRAAAKELDTMIAAWGASEDQLMSEYNEIRRASRNKKRNGS